MGNLPEAAVALFRLHVERQGQIEADESNRELERAGQMLPSRPFVVERVYRLTREGSERKAEIMGCAYEPSPWWGRLGWGLRSKAAARGGTSDGDDPQEG